MVGVLLMYGGHLCHPKGRTQPTNSSTHQHTRPSHTVHHGGTKPRWITSIPGHPSFTRSQQHPHCYSLQKLTHTDQYLHWHSSHFIKAKYTAFNALAHRAKVVSHNQQSLHKELDHIRKALQDCHFPTWTLNKSLSTNTHTQQRTKFHGH